MIRFGIIGTNMISGVFVDACGQVEAVTPAAVYSRDLHRGKDFAAKFGFEAAYDRLDAMLASDIDAVYVASPNYAHHDQVMAAIAAGKHVLCEKTMAASAEQAREMVAAANDAGVVLMEAIRPLYDPAYDIVRAALPRLGPIREVRVEMFQYSSRYDKFKAGEVLNAFNPELGNSSAGDIGVYCIEPLLDLFGIPQTSCGTGVRLANGFEGAGTLVLGYPDMVATTSWSKITESTIGSAIYGELATLTIDKIDQPTHIELRVRGGETEVLHDIPFAWLANFHYELDAFAAQVAAGEPDRRRQQISIETCALMDSYLASLPPAR